MNNYIHKIIDFFFHHEVSDEITERVYNRMVFPVEDKVEKPLNFDPFGHARFAHLFVLYD